MKRIGIIGGMSCESTIAYYQMALAGVRKRLGGFSSPNILINSVDFSIVRKMQENGDWDGAGRFLASQAIDLERGGAEIILLATNTMHKVADQIESAISIPFLHIADAMALKLKENGVFKTGLLGTKFTMLDDFYKNRLLTQHQIETVIPSSEYIEGINSIIFDELCHGEIKETSKNFYGQAIQDLKNQGAGAVILGCTEIGLLIKKQDSELLPICSSEAHIEAALQFSLGKS